MKKQLISIIVIAASLFLINAKSEKNHLDASMIEKSVSPVSSNLYAGKYEVSNWLYRQFLNDLKATNRVEDFKIAQIDSLGWRLATSYNEPLVELYHRHPAYDDYPVVNISYEGANLFCTWLTEKYNSLPGRKFNSIKFFLPTEQEWISAARGKTGNAVYATGNSLKNKKGIPTANYIRTDIRDTTNAYDGAVFTAAVKAYWENDFGIYNMSGNVAEMISDKGVTKGGGFKDKDGDLKIDAKGSYQKPGPDIGFRYFMQVAPTN